MKKAIYISIVFFCSVLIAQEPVSHQFKWISAKSGLRMRDGSSLGAKKLSTIPFGERVDFIRELEEVEHLAGTWGKWTEVDWRGKTGWVYSGFLSDLLPSSNTLSEIPYPEGFQGIADEYYQHDFELCRIEVAGYGFRINEEGRVVYAYEDTSQEYPSEMYDKTVSYFFENGITIHENEGYEWGSSTFEFSKKTFKLADIFWLASQEHRDKFEEYLETRDGDVLMPTESEEWTKQEDYINKHYEVIIENGQFKSLRIDEEEGCGEWWFFEVRESNYAFGSGGGC